MKKIIQILLLITLLLGALVSCENKEDKSQVDLYEKGTKMIDDMINIASTENYVEIFSQNKEINDIVDDLTSKDYQQVKAVYSITFDENEMFDKLLAVGTVDFPNVIKNEMKKKLNLTLGNQINSFDGTNYLVLSSIISKTDLFIRELQEDKIYIYLYDHGYSAYVSFTSHDENIVSAYSTLLFNEELQTIESEKDLKDTLIEILKLENISVESIDI